MSRRIGNQRVQLLLLSTLDKTVSRYHVRSDTENKSTGGRGRLLPEETDDLLIIFVNLVESFVHTLFQAIDAVPPIWKTAY